MLSPLVITYDKYLWTDDMKRYSITSLDKTLTFEIIVTNTDTARWASISSIKVDIKGKMQTDQYPNQVSGQFVENSLWIPPGKSYTRFVMISFQQVHPYGTWALGKWSFELTYMVSGLQWTNATGQVAGSYLVGSQPVPISETGKLEPYPFEFSVVSNAQELEKVLQEKRTGLFNIGPINVTVEIALVSLGGLAVVVWLFKGMSK